MKVNQKSSFIKISGTHYQGDLEAKFEDLKKCFGEPLEASADGKVQNEWIFEFEDGSIGSIYDWKQNGEYTEQPYNWNIGGHFKNVVPKVQKAYKEKMVELSEQIS